MHASWSSIRAAGNVQFGKDSDVTGHVDAGGNGQFGSNNGITGNLKRIIAVNRATGGM